MIHTFGLLKTRKFLPLFITQMLNALNDNILRSAITIFITFKLVSSATYASFWTTIATGMFMLPTLLFSALAGDLADKFKKVYILRAVKIAEVFIVLLTSYLLTQEVVNPSSLVLCVFLMGTHAAIFSPAKFAYLPEYLEQEELLPANGLIEGSTFIVIALGSGLGSLSTLDNGYGLKFLIYSMIILSAAGLISSFLVPPNRAQSPNTHIRKNFLTATQTEIDSAYTNDSIWMPMLGISWFWVLGTVYMTNLVNYVQFSLKYDSMVFAFLNIIFTLGIGIGSLLCNKLMKGEIHTRYVPISLFVTSIFGLHLYSGTYPATDDNTVLGLYHFLTQLHNYRVMADLFIIAVAAGIYVVPLYTILQKNSPIDHCSRIMAATNVVAALFMIVATVVAFFALYTVNISVAKLYLILSILNLPISIYLIKILPASSVKPILMRIIGWLFSIKTNGIENLHAASNRLIVICNHVSYLDGIILSLFLPGEFIFAIDSNVAKWRICKILKQFVELHEIDPTNPMRAKTIAKQVEQGKRLVIFPEGRLTNTGCIMKIYPGPVAIAEWADAEILAVHLGGDINHNRFTRLGKLFKQKIFTPITISILPVFKLKPVDPKISSKEKREIHVQQIYDSMVYASYISAERRTIYQQLLHSGKVHGYSTKILQDMTFTELSYRSLILKTQILGNALHQALNQDSYVGLMLPNTNACAVTVYALYAYRKVPVMMNYTAGPASMASSCVTSNIKTLITSRQFIAKAELTEELKAMRKHLDHVIFLEDIAKNISLTDKLSGAWRYLTLNRFYRKNPQLISNIDSPAVMLITSGSEGTPKVVVLSHRNLVANGIQSLSTMDLNPTDSMFNALPMFHAFGFTLGTITPISYGIPTFLFPNPKQFSTVVELIYDRRSTILIGTNTFLNAYLKVSTSYDFANLRVVFAGGEKLQDETRNAWLEQRGIRVYEGYGTTECGPVISANTLMNNKVGTVGKILPGIEYRFNPFPGVESGGELCIRGENIMLGYIFNENPGQIVSLPNGWYDTGDVVAIDDEGYIKIVDRIKRFAKVSGEMVSLSAIENEVAICWPDHRHGVVSIQDSKRGEKLVLVTEKPDADRLELAKKLKNQGLNPIAIPSKIEFIKQIPVLGTGKVDYPKVTAFLKNLPKQGKQIEKKETDQG
jgi:acyl-[acyl-carrier-protein]-phospholipid O-acyltransferase/long-chain-fatty-acid--[acyl-carrier-protein] ligase